MKRKYMLTESYAKTACDIGITVVVIMGIPAACICIALIATTIKYMWRSL
jgi:hypothetical protein